MSLIAKGKSSDFKPAPEGMWDGVCVDIVDLGMKSTKWGEKHQCKIVWEISELMDDGKPFLAFSYPMTISIGKKANLGRLLSQWRGVPFTKEEIDGGFDVEKVIGAPCKLVITHNEDDGVVYANVVTVMKADPKNKLKPSGFYTRVKDREGYVPPKQESQQSSDNPEYSDTEPEPEFEDESCPF